MSVEYPACPDAQTLYEEFYVKVRSYAFHHLRNREDAEDVTGQVFLKIHEKRAGYNPLRGSYSTWIYAITRNTVREAQRRTARRRTDADAFEPDQFTSPDPLPEEILLASEQLEALAAALERLPERERDILIFRFYDGLPSKEVAVRMNLSDANVRYLQSKAIARLRDWLDV